MSEVTVFLVDDSTESVQDFKRWSEDLKWIPKIAEIGSKNLQSAYEIFSKLSPSNTDWDWYKKLIGLSDTELEGLSKLKGQIIEILSKITVEDIKLGVTAFQMNSYEAYYAALEAIKESSGICFLLLDVDWSTGNGKWKNLDLLTATEIRSIFTRPGYRREFAPACNVGYEFLNRGPSHYLISATTQGNMNALIQALQPETKERCFVNDHVIGPDSVMIAGAPAKVVELLYVLFERHLASPVNRLRLKAEFWSNSANKNAWFNNDASSEVPHNFPKDESKRRTVTELIRKLVQVPSIDPCCYEGFKSFSLPGRNIGPETVYAVALLANAQREQSTLKVDAPIPSGLIPVLKNRTGVIEDGFDFAETLLIFFKALLDEKTGQLSISFNVDDNTKGMTPPLKIRSPRYVDNLFGRVKEHLNNFSHTGAWLGQHTDSLPLARCIEYGKWGLVGPNGEIRRKAGPFTVMMEGKEIYFGWEKEE